MRDIIVKSKSDAQTKIESLPVIKNINVNKVINGVLGSSMVKNKVLNLQPVKKFLQIESTIDTAIKKAQPFLKATGLDSALGIKATIGSWGKNLVFEVSADSVRTFQNLKTTAGAKYADIDLLEGKPRKQFIAPAIRTASMDINLRSDLNWFKPRDMIDLLQNCIETAEANYLIIGGRPLSDNPYILTDLSFDWGIIYSRGELQNVKISVTFEEYDPKSHIKG